MYFLRRVFFNIIYVEIQMVVNLLGVSCFKSLLVVIFSLKMKEEKVGDDLEFYVFFVFCKVKSICYNIIFINIFSILLQINEEEIVLNLRKLGYRLGFIDDIFGFRIF